MVTIKEITNRWKQGETLIFKVNFTTLIIVGNVITIKRKGSEYTATCYSSQIRQILKDDRQYLLSKEEATLCLL